MRCPEAMLAYGGLKKRSPTKDKPLKMGDRVLLRGGDWVPNFDLAYRAVRKC